MPNKGYSFDAKKLIKNIQADLNKEAKRQNLSVPMQTDVNYSSNPTISYAPFANLHQTMPEKKADSVVPRKEYDLFISHASKDKLTYVDSLHKALSQLGIRIFYDKDSIDWGDNWKQEILNGTATAEFAIIVISNEFFGREWTELELREFLLRQNDTGQKIILPLLYNVTQEQLKTHYSQLADIQCLNTENYTVDNITVLFAKELIKRLKENTVIGISSPTTLPSDKEKRNELKEEVLKAVNLGSFVNTSQIAAKLGISTDEAWELLYELLQHDRAISSGGNPRKDDIDGNVWIKK